MAADSGRLREVYAPAHTERGRCHPDTSYRVPKRSSGRSSARRVGPQVLQRHHGVAKGASDRSSARRPCPQVLQRHHGVAKGGFWTVFGTATPPIGAPEASSRGEASPNRSQNGPFPMHQSVFGTESRPTGAPEASRRGKGGFWTVFGTATPSTGAPEASRRGKGGFWPVFGTATLPTST